MFLFLVQTNRRRHFGQNFKKEQQQNAPTQHHRPPSGRHAKYTGKKQLRESGNKGHTWLLPGPALDWLASTADAHSSLSVRKRKTRQGNGGMWTDLLSLSTHAHCGEGPPPSRHHSCFTNSSHTHKSLGPSIIYHHFPSLSNQPEHKK